MEPDPADLTLPKSDRQELIRWSAACVERLLSAVAADHPQLSDALDAARAFAAGHVGVGRMREHAFACHAAARDESDVTAAAVARACGQAVAVAHMAGHGRAIATYTRKALTGTRRAQELQWQRSQIPCRFRQYVYGDTT